MARYFRQIKHRYTSDTGRVVIRSQRVYVMSSDPTVVLSPITPLLLAREVDTIYKIDKYPNKTRRLQVYVNNTDNQSGYSILNMTIPYNAISPLLNRHVQEILAHELTVCGDYIGESHDY